jgi:hypothetical protein
VRCQLVPVIAAGVALLGGAVADAQPAGLVPATGDPGAGLLHAEVDYSYEADRAVITRERVGDPAADPQGPLPRQRELESHQTRQLVTPRLELAVYRGFWVSLAAPIVIGQTSEIDVAGGVDRASASTFIDGILPATGFDARNPSAPPGGNVAFRGVTRRGVQELRAGLGFAAMNQARDATQPTWKLGAELGISAGRAMRFDAVHPDQETGVASGVDQLRLWTSLDRRYRYFESWFAAAWQVPIYTRASGLFTDPGFGASNIAPGQTATASFGVAAELYDDAATGRRISVELGARGTVQFEGRGYSELWEVFALAGDRRTAGPLVLDGDPTTPGTQGVSHPGITNIESYLEAAARLTVRVKLGARLRLAAYGELIGRTEHVISFTDAGTDLPTCPTGAPRCETGDNTAVTPGTAEVNPLQVPLIDLVGHRYRAEANLGVVIGLEAQVVF